MFCNGKKFIGLAILLASLSLNANAAPTIGSFIDKMYIGIEGGGTRTVNTTLAPDWAAVSRQYTWVSYPTYTNNSNANTWNMGTGLNLGAKVGYEVNEFINVDIAYNRRGNFSLTSSDGLTYTNGLPILLTGVGSSGCGYKFNPINSQAVTVNTNVFLPITWDKFKPFLSAGLGIAWNKLGEMRSIMSPGLGTNLILSGNTQNSFTWQLGAGIEYAMTKNFALDLAYRFVDMGNFISGTSFIDQASVVSGDIQPFRMNHVGANEFYIGLKYKL